MLEPLNHPLAPHSNIKPANSNVYEPAPSRKMSALMRQATLATRLRVVSRAMRLMPIPIPTHAFRHIASISTTDAPALPLSLSPDIGASQAVIEKTLTGTAIAYQVHPITKRITEDCTLIATKYLQTPVRYDMRLDWATTKAVAAKAEDNEKLYDLHFLFDRFPTTTEKDEYNPPLCNIVNTI